MTILHALVLSIVEGITEFLPVSSTGHLILASDLLKLAQTDFVKTFEIVIQLGAVLAVTGLYARRAMVNRAMLVRLVAAFLPAAVVGFLLLHFIKRFLLGNTTVTLTALLVGGIVLLLVEWLHREKDTAHTDMAAMSVKTAFIIGLCQALAVVPGVSRSGATIVGGMLTGLTRKASVEFSFLLAIPTIAAATVLDLFSAPTHFSGQEWLLLGIGTLGAFVSALAAVKTFLRFIERHTFVPFAIYRILLAVLFWLFVVR